MPTLLSEQVRDSIPWTEVPFHFNAGPPQQFNLGVICSNWMSLAGSTITISIERSIDGKVTWTGFGGVGMQCGILGKGTTPALQEEHAKWFGVTWDGLEMDLRAKVDIGPAPFAWGLKTVP